MSADFALLEKNDAYTAEMRAELKALLDEIGANMDLLKFISTQVAEQAKLIADNISTNYPELLPEAAPEEVLPEEDTNVSVDEYDKYEAAEATIVYEQYSNGKTFVLNFNNFAVKVTINGVSYTVAAYGYVVIN